MKSMNTGLWSLQRKPVSQTWALRSDGTIAEEQLAMLFTDMLAEYNQGNYTIAGGDFNKDLLGNSSEIFGVSGPAYTWAQPIPASLIPANGVQRGRIGETVQNKRDI